eukprot:GILK01013146.1.p1 GENE.GILK01013146.1~~GILK01013146.1.p1  ORF type:complete len:591 (+),score=72.09 GILK01013146.1:269-2041(+)
MTASNVATIHSVPTPQEVLEQGEQIQQKAPPQATAAVTSVPAQTPRSTPSSGLKVFWTFFVIVLIIGPTVAGYILQWKTWGIEDWALGVYGVVMLAFFLLQILFCTINRCQVASRRRNRDSASQGIRTGLLVVGYREDPVLFRQCLHSVKNLQYSNLTNFMVVVDGNEQPDSVMGTIFTEVFADNVPLIITIDFRPDAVSPSDPKMQSLVAEIQAERRPICILQPHAGKRHALYTGFQILLAQGCEAVVVTDSDTSLDVNSVQELAATLEDPKVGAATGNVRVWNTQSLIAFLTSLRYWYAFNIERGAQSFWGCVLCVSGPLGIYRGSTLNQIMNDWVKQTFFGVPCTFGDDRHLTNLVLRTGQKVKYTHLASCLTETPATLSRWITQQTRWCKSFHREFFLNVQWFHKQSIWMGGELTYHAMFPYFFMYSVLRILYTGSVWQLTLAMFCLAASTTLKSIYALIVSGNFGFLLFPLYGPLYIIGLIPAKLWAFLTLWDISWGTSARGEKPGLASRVWTTVKYLFAPTIWFGVLCAGVVYNFYRADWTVTFREQWGLVAVAGYFAALFVLYGIGRVTGLIKKSTLKEALPK